MSTLNMGTVKLDGKGRDTVKLTVEVGGESFDLTACVSAGGDGALVVWVDGDHEAVRVNVNDGMVYEGRELGEIELDGEPQTPEPDLLQCTTVELGTVEGLGDDCAVDIFYANTWSAETMVDRLLSCSTANDGVSSTTTSTLPDYILNPATEASA